VKRTVSVGLRVVAIKDQVTIAGCRGFESPTVSIPALTQEAFSAEKHTLTVRVVQ
jgi:hypothetical protein